jgi:hypothetical protein
LSVKSGTGLDDRLEVVPLAAGIAAFLGESIERRAIVKQVVERPGKRGRLTMAAR